MNTKLNSIMQAGTLDKGGSLYFIRQSMSFAFSLLTSGILVRGVRSQCLFNRVRNALSYSNEQECNYQIMDFHVKAVILLFSNNIVKCPHPHRCGCHI